MITIPQIRKPETNITAPKADLHPVLTRCIDMPLSVNPMRKNPRIIPAAIWKGNIGPIMATEYNTQEAA